MIRLARRGLAWGIMATFAGLLVEAQLPDGRWQRAPLTGSLVLAGVAALTWADSELERAR